jgi:hypothetical protein
VYGFTVAIVGTFDLMRNVGMISNSEATITASATSTVNVVGRPSHLRCQWPGALGLGGGPASRTRGGASTSTSAYLAGRVCQVLKRL